jgi:putative two-component system response regulator
MAQSIASFRAGFAVSGRLPVIACAYPGDDITPERRSMADGDHQQRYSLDPTTTGLAGIETVHAPILIVDDQPDIIQLLSTILTVDGYRAVHTTTDPTRALSLVETLRPHLVLLDLMMPQMDGFTVMEQLRANRPPSQFLPILVLTADATLPTRRRALASGATDFLTKPFDHIEVRLRVGNLLRTQALQMALLGQAERLDQQVRERTAELEQARLDTLTSLALAAEYRDDATGQHTRRVAELAARIARALGLPDDAVERLLQAAPLHDVGKIGIPDEILLKPARLTASEREYMKRHTLIGAELLSVGRSSTLRLARQIALTHHERWDGYGYPTGLAGADIPIEGRIVALADTWDALIHERPYKPAWPLDAAASEIAQLRGSQFDPLVVDAFFDVVQQTG